MYDIKTQKCIDNCDNSKNILFNICNYDEQLYQYCNSNDFYYYDSIQQQCIKCEYNLQDNRCIQEDCPIFYYQINNQQLCTFYCRELSPKNNKCYQEEKQQISNCYLLYNLECHSIKPQETFLVEQIYASECLFKNQYKYQQQCLDQCNNIQLKEYYHSCVTCQSMDLGFNQSQQTCQDCEYVDTNYQCLEQNNCKFKQLNDQFTICYEQCPKFIQKINSDICVENCTQFYIIKNQQKYCQHKCDMYILTDIGLQCNPQNIQIKFIQVQKLFDQITYQIVNSCNQFKIYQQQQDSLICSDICQEGYFENNICVKECQNKTLQKMPSLIYYINESSLICIQQCQQLKQEYYDQYLCVDKCDQNYYQYQEYCLRSCPYQYSPLNNICQLLVCQEQYFYAYQVNQCIKSCEDIDLILDAEQDECTTNCESGIGIYSNYTHNQYYYPPQYICTNNCDKNKYQYYNYQFKNLQFSILCIDICQEYIQQPICINICQTQFIQYEDTNKYCIQDCIKQDYYQTIYTQVDYNNKQYNLPIKQCTQNCSLFIFNQECVDQCPNGTWFNDNMECIANCSYFIVNSNDQKCYTSCPTNISFQDDNTKLCYYKTSSIKDYLSKCLFFIPFLIIIVILGFLLHKYIKKVQSNVNIYKQQQKQQEEIIINENI